MPVELHTATAHSNVLYATRVEDALPATVTQSMPWNEKIRTLVTEMAKHPQVPCPLKHFFAPGVYIREIFMPAGAIVIGKIHKTEHFNIIQQGRVALVDETGTIELCGPTTFVSHAGVQKTLYIYEDTIWSTIHLTTERDLDALEAQLITPDPSYPAFCRADERQAITHAAQAEQKYLEHS